MEDPSQNTADLKKALRILADGGVVGIPTETVYGLAARIDRDDGLRRIFELKERPFFDPLIVHIADFADLPKVVGTWPPAAEILARKYWPGPLTLIVKRASELNELITAGLDTVGVRMPNQNSTLALIRGCGTPLAAPSANKFKKTSPTRAAHVTRQFPDIFVLDGGATEVGLESTVAAVREDRQGNGVRVLIHRPGMVTATELLATLAAAGIDASIEYDQGSAASPGTLEEHYQPAKPLVIVDESPLNERKAAELALRVLGRPNGRIAWLELVPSAALAARTLYADLHRLGQDPSIDCIAVERKRAHACEEWRAIWDRLDRAAKAGSRFHR